MYVSYQFNAKGFINVEVCSVRAPICANQLLFDEAIAPKIFGRLYNAQERKAYVVMRDESGSPILDENNEYVINEAVEAIDVSNAITGEN